MSRCQRVHILDVSFGKHQYVLLGDRSNVFESDDMLVLVTQRLLIGYDLAKLALLQHVRIPGTLELHLNVKVIPLISHASPSSQSDHEHERQH